MVLPSKIYLVNRRPNLDPAKSFKRSKLANSKPLKTNTGTSERSIFGFRVKERNFAKRRILQFTDVLAGMGKAKSRHDMDTAGVRVEIISLCKSTDLFFIKTVL